MFAFLTIPVLFTKPVMTAFGVDPNIASLASNYVLICIPGVFCYSLQSCYNRFLTGQRVTFVAMYANIAATLCHWILAPLLTIYFEMGMIGVSISSSFQFFVRFVVVYGYINFSGKFDAVLKEVPLFFHPENFRNWK